MNVVSREMLIICPAVYFNHVIYYVILEIIYPSLMIEFYLEANNPNNDPIATPYAAAQLQQGND